MDIERHGRDFVESGYDGNTDTYLRYKVAIHDIHVENIAMRIESLYSGCQIGLIGRQKRRCNKRRPQRLTRKVI